MNGASCGMSKGREGVGQTKKGDMELLLLLAWLSPKEDPVNLKTSVGNLTLHLLEMGCESRLIPASIHSMTMVSSLGGMPSPSKMQGIRGSTQVCSFGQCSRHFLMSRG